MIVEAILGVFCVFMVCVTVLICLIEFRKSQQEVALDFEEDESWGDGIEKRLEDLEKSTKRIDALCFKAGFKL